MNWLAFKNAVRVDLPLDNDRIAIATGNTNYLDQQILHAVIQVQQLIPFYQKGHETVYGPQDLTMEGLASVGTIPQTEQCHPQDAFYKKTGKQCVSQPLVPYSWSNRYDLVCGNPRVTNCQFFMALEPHGQQFVVFPHVGRDHQISFNWDGVKTAFNDADETPFDMDVVEAVGLFVRSKLAAMVDHDLPESNFFLGLATRRRGLLFADAKDRTRLNRISGSEAPSNRCANSVGICTDRGATCFDPEHNHEDTTEFCAFGDSGDPGTIANTAAVSVLVKSLEPDFILQMGDINYPNGDPVTLQDNFLKYYGLYVPDQAYFAFGNHDIATDGGAALDALFARQAALNPGKRYYDFIPEGRRHRPGFCHLFALDTNFTQPSAEQFAWLQAQLAASTEFWNIIYFHEAPYTSDVAHAPGNLTMRQLYKDWGAHLVISAHGHNYERLQGPDGLPYIVAGLGGGPSRGFVSPPTPGSQFRYNSFYGCLYVTARRDQLQVTFYDTRGEAIDSLALERERVFA